MANMFEAAQGAIKFVDTIQDFEPTRQQNYHKQATAQHDQEPFNPNFDLSYKKYPVAGVKHDEGKLRVGLIPAEAIEQLAEVYTIGARKYSDNNFLKGMNYSRIQDALLRHYLKWAKGETYDQEDGQHHLASVAWCALALIMYQKHGLGVDDRWMPPAELYE